MITVLTGMTGCDAPDRDHHADDRTAIETGLRQWSADFNAERLDAVCGLFADDAVLIYPDSPDRDHEAFCGQMRQLFDDPHRTFRYAAPEIDEILLDGDTAAVRLVWTLTVSDESGRVLETVREDGLDLFQRQDDGTWKIRISHAFTRDD